MLKNTTAIKKGDVIVGVREERDNPRTDHKFAKPVTVTKVVRLIDNGEGTQPTVHFHVRQDKGSVISPDRYLGTPQVEVGRPVTLAGIKFLKMDEDTYVQADGPWRIERDDIPYECDDAHPVRLTRKTAQEILAQPYLWSFEARTGAQDFINGMYNEQGKRVKGYMCPGCEEHQEKQWVAARDDEDHFDHQGMWQDTPTEVAKLIAQGFYA